MGGGGCGGWFRIGLKHMKHILALSRRHVAPLFSDSATKICLKEKLSSTFTHISKFYLISNSIYAQQSFFHK